MKGKTYIRDKISKDRLAFALSKGVLQPAEEVHRKQENLVYKRQLKVPDTNRGDFL